MKRLISHEFLSNHPLFSPQIHVGIENPVSQDVEKLLEFRSFGEVVKVGTHYVVNIGRITGPNDVNLSKPRTIEKKSIVASLKCLSTPIVNPMNVKDKLRQHPNNWKALWRSILISQAAEEQKANESQDSFKNTDQCHEIARKQAPGYVQLLMLS